MAMGYYRVKQRDTTDCGAACLTAIAGHYKLIIQVAKVRQYAGTDKNGTTMLGLKEAADRLGFEARGVKTTALGLSCISLPAIAHLNIDNRLLHYVVIYEVNKHGLIIMEPSTGRLISQKWSIFEKQWTGILLLLSPGMDFKEQDYTISVFTRFWQILKPHRNIFPQVLIAAIIYTLLGLSTSIYIQQLTDYILIYNDQSILISLGIGMLLMICFQTFLGITKNLFILQTGQQIDSKLIMDYYRHLLKLPQSFFDTMRIGEIISRVNDVLKIRWFINDMAVNLIVNLLLVISASALMFTHYWKLALLLLSMMPIYALLFFTINRLNKRISQKLLEQSANLETHWIESLTTIGTIKKFGLENFFKCKTENKLKSLSNTLGLSGKITIYGNGAVDFSSKIITILLLSIGAKHVIDKEISAGQLFSCYALVQYFTGPILVLLTSSKNMQDARIAANRLFEIMDLEPERETGKIGLNTEQLGDIRFQEVCFRYSARNTVFHNLTCQIKKGSFTAIVGESGSGKSTLVALLQLLYPLQSGRITIGDYSLDQFCKETFKRSIAVVPQKVHLFTGNLIDNIAVGERNPDYKRIVDLCLNLGMRSMIESLPQGLHTNVGENGSLLSGGQIQRIALARALYQNPEILILDEATSSLDVNAEIEIKKAIALLIKKNKTVLFVTHRLATIQKASQIIVLKGRTIAEIGTHDELINNKSDYYQLWQKQLPMRS